MRAKLCVTMCPDCLGTGLDGPSENGAGMAGWWLALIPIECGRRSAPEQERRTLEGVSSTTRADGRNANVIPPHS